jgi:HPt (histidine-containing phosphotransfer) domain-containing protein
VPTYNALEPKLGVTMPSLLGDSTPIYLDTQLAMSQIGDASTMLEMLAMLDETLAKDISQIADSLDQGDVAQANTLLHPLKGFLPIFCTAQLCDDLFKVESMSKTDSATDVRNAYAELRPKLDRLLEEVADYLSTHGRA